MECARCKGRLFFTEKGGQWVRECPICGKMEAVESKTITSEEAVPSKLEACGVDDDIPTLLKEHGKIYHKDDLINHPPHYQIGGIETIDIIEVMLSPEEYQGYLKGTIIKYRERAGHKGSAESDYAKALWFMKRLQAIDKR